MQIGAYIGYTPSGSSPTSSAGAATFMLYIWCAAVLVPLYGQMARSPWSLMALGPLLGFFGYGYFSLFGGFLAELFPTARPRDGAGHLQPRPRPAPAPYTIGALANSPASASAWRSLTSAFFLLRGSDLDAAGPQRPGARRVAW